MTKLIFGCGYLGERVARRWQAASDRVIVVTRRAARARKLERQAFEAIVADVTRPTSLANLPPADTVLYAVGFDRASGESIFDVYEGGMRNVLDALAEHGSPRFVYISTTGVYGSANGDWVDEETSPTPQRDGGRASLGAEQALAAHRLGRNGVILRLAGIYGPKRIPFLNELRTGQAIPAPSAGYLNLIHVDDAAEVVLAVDELAAFDNGPRIYCVSDGHPVVRGDYYREFARQIGAPMPTFVDPDLESARARRAAANRRVSNARLRRELDVAFTYGDYRAGLSAILSSP